MKCDIVNGRLHPQLTSCSFKQLFFFFFFFSKETRQFFFPLIIWFALIESSFFPISVSFSSQATNSQRGSFHCGRGSVGLKALSHAGSSSLPANLKENILLKLPIKDAVRTTVLSSKWIDFWVSIPHLVFEPENGLQLEPEFIKVVDMVLLLHQGPIETFELFSNYNCNEAIGRWLLILSRNGIKHLNIQIEYNDRCRITFRLISCIALERLCLRHCSINFPASFQGFRQMHTLYLMECNLSGVSIENMVSSCPLLDRLVLHFVKTGSFHIRAPNLTYLQIVDDELNDVCLETPKLVSAWISIYITFGDHQKFSIPRNRDGSNFMRALGCLSNIQKLVIDGAFTRYLAIGPIPENLPAIFNHLTDLSVHNLEIKPNEISAALCLLRNAPNLEELFMGVVTEDQPPVEAAWKSKAVQDRLYKHLKVVTLQNHGGMRQGIRPLVEFAKLVLSSAPVLEKLIFYGCWLEHTEIARELYPKWSKNVEIKFHP